MTTYQSAALPTVKVPTNAAGKRPNEITSLVKYPSKANTSDVVAVGKASQLQLTANLITGGLGTGIFTLPWSTAGASITTALSIIAAVLLLNAWTVSILVRAAERHQTFDLGSLLRRLPGPLGRAAQCACNAGLWASLFLCLVGYVTVMADCAESALPHGHRPSLVLLSAALVLPLCFLDQERLSVTSTMCVAVNLNIFAVLAKSFVQGELESTRPPVCYVGLGMGSIAMLSAMMQAVIVQMCVLPMYAEMKDRTPEKFDRVVAISFSALFILFAAFSVAGYLSVGAKVQSNILLDLPHTFWGQSSRFGGAIGVMAVYPIMMKPIIAPIERADPCATYGLTPKNAAAAATCGITTAVALTACFVSDLGFLNVVNGAMSLGVFVALAPGLVGLYLLGPLSQQCPWRSAMYALVVCGFAFAALGLRFTSNYADTLHTSCLYGFGV